MLSERRITKVPSFVLSTSIACLFPTALEQLPLSLQRSFSLILELDQQVQGVGPSLLQINVGGLTPYSQQCQSPLDRL